MKIFDFINHATIKSEYKGKTVITDPWIISNAFGSWYQNPSPIYKDVFEMIDSDETLGVLISHGHDDHLDEWFIKKHLPKNKYFCTKFKTPGLENRLKDNLGLNVRLISDQSKFGDFKFKQFINPDYTKYDAVITIETPHFLIIHANDNWHEWPKEMANKIANLAKKYNKDYIFLLIQFGVADCFPVNYKGINLKDAQNILNERFEGYLYSTEQNMQAIGLKKMYYYANQSLFDYKECDLEGKSISQLSEKFLLSKKSQYIQLKPGMSIYSGHKIKFINNKVNSLFRYCLKSFENFINKSYENYTGDKNCIKVNFRTPEESDVKNQITYFASHEVWNRIITGELNLESIIIGGAGVISKPDINIRDHHMFISKRSYIAQNKILNSGLSFFREFNDE